jgi:F0F1-type ATP synthase membrane subunit b/b'
MRFFHSVKALYSAVGILFLTFILGYYLDVQNEAMNSRHLQISIALEKMVRLDQELTGMLALAVVERNEMRVTRYETVRQDVEAAIQKVIDLTKDQSMTQEISALRR